MNCFDNLIGIRDCNMPAPSSGLYIQDLPGMTLRIANAAVDQETISGVELIKEKITLSQNAILAQMRTLLKDKTRVNSLIESDNVGYYKENLKVVLAEAGQLKGIKLKIEQNQYLEFYLSKVYLKVAQTGIVPVYIYDLLSNKLLDTINIDCEDGVASAVIVNKTYQTNRQRLNLFICYDASISGYESSVSKPSGCYSCENQYSNKYVKFYSGKIDSSAQKIDSNIKSGSGTAGVSIEYSVNCSLESFICSMGGLIAYPLLYKVGAEILREVLISKRLNSIVLLNKETTKELKEYFEVEYEKAMEGVTLNLKLPKDICFSCNYTIRKTVQIP